MRDLVALSFSHSLTQVLSTQFEWHFTFAEHSKAFAKSLRYDEILLKATKVWFLSIDFEETWAENLRKKIWKISLRFEKIRWFSAMFWQNSRLLSKTWIWIRSFRKIDYDENLSTRYFAIFWQNVRCKKDKHSLSSLTSISFDKHDSSVAKVTNNYLNLLFQRRT